MTETTHQQVTPHPGDGLHASEPQHTDGAGHMDDSHMDDSHMDGGRP